jgi:hypothetical protein
VELIIKKNRSFSLPFRLLSALLFIYIVLRAWLVPITIDEVITYREFVQDSWWHIITYYHCSANNHLLNTLLMKVFAIAGNSPFVLRLPNVLLFVLYLFYSWRLSALIPGKLQQICAFLLLNVNPFMLDFFALARGYGMALSLMMASLYHVMAAYRQKGNIARDINRVLLFGVLAMLANFSMLNYFLLLSALLLAIAVLKGNGSYGIKYISGLAPHVAILAYISFIIFRLQKSGALYYGGTRGFFDDTLASLIRYGSYSLAHTAEEVRSVQYFVIAIICIAFAAAVWLVIKRQLHRYAFLWMPLYFITGLFAAIELQHILFNSPFAIQRTGIYFIPLFALLLIGMAQTMPGRIENIFFIAFAALGLAVLFRSINTSYTMAWKEDASAPVVLTDLHKAYNSIKHPLQLQVFWIEYPALAYNEYRNKTDTWLACTGQIVKDTSDIDHGADFYYVPESVLPKLNWPVAIEKSYASSGMLLLRNTMVKRNVLVEYASSTSTEQVGIGNFSSSIQIPADTLPLDRQLEVEGSCKVFFDGKKKTAQLIVSVSDSAGHTIAWLSSAMSDIFDQTPGWRSISYRETLPLLHKKDRIAVSVWNTDDQPLEIQGIKATIMDR